jgi:hypothetical protein
MYIDPKSTNNHAIASQLSWLTTKTFEQLGFPVLAVVLAGSTDRDLLTELEKACRQIDSQSNRILIITTGTTPTATASSNPAWVEQHDNELRLRLEGIRWQDQWRARERQEPEWGTFAEASIRLLDLEPACLPAVYVRFACKPNATARSSAVVVPIADVRAGAVTRFLTRLSTAADDHEDGSRDMIDFLEGEGRAGWAVSASTQRALDRVLALDDWRNNESLDKPSDDVAELERLATTWSTVLRSAGSSHPSDVVREAKQYFAPARFNAAAALYRPDLAAALDLAGHAWNVQEYGTVVRNVGAACEAMVSASLFHAVRGVHGVRLPRYLDAFDRARGNLQIAGAEFNRPRHVLVGDWTDEEHERTPWKAPPLAAGLQAFETCLPDMDPGRIGSDGCRALLDVLREVAKLRNPAAHGEQTTRDAAKGVLELLETLVLSGQMAAMAAIRSGFQAGPRMDPSALLRIQKDPRPHYERCREEVALAKRKLDERTTVSQDHRRRVTQLRDAIERLAALLSKPALSSKDIHATPELRDTCPGLPGWADVQRDVAMREEAARRVKVNARLASRWFSAPGWSDRKRLGDISRLLGAGPDAIRTNADIEAILAGIDAILEDGVIRPSPKEDWRAPIRESLEEFLAFASRYAEHVMSSDAPRQHVANWTGLLEIRLVQATKELESTLSEIDDANATYACATARVQGACHGAVPRCTCGGHTESSRPIRD